MIDLARRRSLQLAGLVIALPTMVLAQAEDLPEIKVYKTPTCGCCVKWIAHLEENGFTVVSETLENLGPIKAANAVPPQLASCHTATVNGYAIEGHVPADIIVRLLREQPEIAGISVPGMPAGSPGMEMGNRRDPYKVISFDKDGNLAVYDQR